MSASTLRSFILLVFLLSSCRVWQSSPGVKGGAPAAPSGQTAAPAQVVTHTQAATPPPMLDALTPEPLQQTPTTPAAALAASPTPVPILRQLASGGCCTQPFWSPDGQWVLYIDRPSQDAPAGLWGIPIEGGEPRLISARLGIFSPDMSLAAYPENRQTIVERLEDGTRWTIPSEGRAVSFSPDSAQVAWTAGQSSQSFEPTRREIWVSRADGQEPHAVFQVFGGGLAGWFPDGRLLISGRLALDEEKQALWVVSQETGESVELLRVSRPRGILISPAGDWLATASVFDTDPAQNGLWLVNTQTLEQFKLDKFGAFRWRDAHRLLVVPLDTSQAQHRFWEYDTRKPPEMITQAVPLTDPDITPLRIANGDWAVAPGGQHIVFISAQDHNLWVLDLPGE